MLGGRLTLPLMTPTPRRLSSTLSLHRSLEDQDVGSGDRECQQVVHREGNSNAEVYSECACTCAWSLTGAMYRKTALHSSDDVQPTVLGSRPSMFTPAPQNQLHRMAI